MTNQISPISDETRKPLLTVYTNGSLSQLAQKRSYLSFSERQSAIENKGVSDHRVNDDIDYKNNNRIEQRKGSALKKLVSFSGERTYVYIKNEENGWIPAELVSKNSDGGVVIPRPSPKAKPLSDNNYTQRMAFENMVEMEDANENKENDEKINEKIENTELEEITVVSSTYTNDNAELVDLSKYKNSSLPLQDVDNEGKLITREDLCDISHLHEASILYNLKERFEGEHGVPYTRAGDIIISINPYRWIKGLYSENTRYKYANHLVWKGAYYNKRQALQPHVYETSAKAFKGLTQDGQNQSILVSGESGAGKTVTVKLLMSHLATFEDTKYKIMEKHVVNENKFITIEDIIEWIKERIRLCLGFEIKQAHYEDIPQELDDEPEELKQNNPIVQRVLDSNPLLEAFGNAKTGKNDNSSRFSKYTKLLFDVKYVGQPSASAVLAGSDCETYLLEKSRVISRDKLKGERNFHVFYQLLAAPDKEKEKIWKGLIGATPSSFKFLSGSETDIIEGLSDGKRWLITKDKLKSIGVDEDQTTDLMKGLCIILQLGNLTFERDASKDITVISSKDELTKLSEIFGLPETEIEDLFTIRNIKPGHEIITRVHILPTDAKDLCNSLAKELYALLFYWLVSVINEATSIEQNYVKGNAISPYTRVIGLLDIFGFETKDVNVFEQLCINYANEKLQEKFTHDIFWSVKDEYQAEGIDISEVEHDDNSHVLKLIEGDLGLIDLLNEQCRLTTGSHKAFVAEFYRRNNSLSSPLIKKKLYRECEFGIKHYAGDVTYDATNFVEKNQDTLPKDVEMRVKSCGNKLIKQILLKQQIVKKMNNSITKRNHNLLKGRTVWTKFKKQLTTLMKEIGNTKTWYVRCINPNKRKDAGVMDLQYTVAQLRCAGIVSAITMAMSSFLNRLQFDTALDRFSILSKQNRSAFTNFWPKKTDPKLSVQTMLDVLLKPMEFIAHEGEITKAFVCGESRVYFRPGALEYLESERLKIFERSAVVIQCFVRCMIARSKYNSLRESEPRRRAIEKRSMCFPMDWFQKLINNFFFIPSISAQLWTHIRQIPLWPASI